MHFHKKISIFYKLKKYRKIGFLLLPVFPFQPAAADTILFASSAGKWITAYLSFYLMQNQKPGEHLLWKIRWFRADRAHKLLLLSKEGFALYIFRP